MQEAKHRQLRSGLPHTAAKLRAGQAITVAFLGGSITEGAGASDTELTSWRARTGQYFTERYPGQGGTHRFINAGVGGTTSTFGAHRLQAHVFDQGPIDLLFVEFSVNDGEDREESIRGMEGIVRQSRRLSPPTDIVFIYTAADKNLEDELPFNIAVHEEVAAHYAIPSVNLAGNVRALIREGQATWESIAPDRVHPNDAGFERYALYVADFLDEAIQEQGSGQRDAAEQIWQDGVLNVERPLPAPLLTKNDEFATMSDYRSIDDHGAFQLAVLCDEPLMNWRYDTTHLVADGNSGESLSFTVAGQRAGIVLLHGPDSGIFEYAIDEGGFMPMNLYDEWCLLAYRPVLAMFPYLPDHEEHQVTIRCTGTKDERSKGTSIRILGLLRS